MFEELKISSESLSSYFKSLIQAQQFKNSSRGKK